MLSTMSEETVAPPSSVKLFGKTIVSSEDTNDSSSSSVVTKVSDHNEKNSGILLKGSEEDEEENKTLQGKIFSSTSASEPDKKRNTVLATVSSKNYVDMKNSGILKKGFDENNMENKSFQGKAISSSSVSEAPMKRNTVLSPVSSKSYGCMKNSQIPNKGFDEADMENKSLPEKIASSSSLSEVPKKRCTVFSAVSSKNSVDMKNSQILDKGFEKDDMENKTFQGKLISSSSASEPPKKPNTVLPCPRCDSTDTKFCYYNNYNVNQPRHFCRNCQRYWTAGGLLRNVPIGSGRRKNKHPGREDLVGSPRVFGNNHDCVSSEDSGKIGDNGVENEEIIASEKRDFAENVVKEERKGEEQLPCCGNGISQMWPFYYGGFYGNLPYPFMMGPEGGIKSNVGDFVTQSLPWLQQVPGTNPLPIPQNFYPGYPWTVPQLSWYHPSSPWGLPLMPGVLGKHGREEEDSNADSPNGDVVVDSKCRNDGSLWVPKTLRIDDPGEAAKSSIWSTLGTGNKSDSITSGGIFKAFHPKVDRGEKIVTKDNEQVLCANPAASSRSASFKENT